jgi:leader peptidase (prepilin peptidase)/N-methyltransferase
MPMEIFTALSPGLLAVFAGIFGLVIGSFLNVVIYRLPEGLSVAWPGSRCPGCETPIAWYDNLPVLSYLLLRGRCRHCQKSISPRYPAIELATGLLFAGLALRFGATLLLPVWCLFTAALVAAAAIDFDHQIIPDEISLGGLALALVLVPTVNVMLGSAVGPAVVRSAAGAALGGGMLWIVGFLHARACVALGREFDHWPEPGEALPTPGTLDYWIWFPGVGFGDVKLLAMIGAVLGPFGVAQTILLASILGLVLGIAFAIATRSWDAPFGFGPAIAAGALLALFLPGGLPGLF